MRVCPRLFAVAVILLALSRTVTAQQSLTPDTTAPRFSRISLTLTAGYAVPESKDALTQFWKGGPEFGLSFLVRTTPALYVGVGADVSVLWFRWSSFAQAYPSVPVRRT